MKLFEKKKKIYLHETDATDIVYYSRHLEWYEETRIDFIGTIYKPLNRIITEDRISFLPINLNIEYKTPAMFEDEITIKMGIKEIDKIKMILDYTVVKEINGKEMIVSKANITMLCIDIEKGGRPSKIPENILNILKEWL